MEQAHKSHQKNNCICVAEQTRQEILEEHGINSEQPAISGTPMVFPYATQTLMAYLSLSLQQRPRPLAAFRTCIGNEGEGPVATSGGPT